MTAPTARVFYGVMKRQKPSSEAEQHYQADVTLAGRREELLGTAREADKALRQLIDEQAPAEDGVGATFGQLLAQWL